VVARLLAPALLLHFALVFPERTEAARKLFARLAIVYGPPLLLLLLHLNVAFNTLGFLPWLGPRIFLDKLELSYLAACFILAGLVFLLQLPEFAIWSFAPAVEMAFRRNACRKFAVRDFLCVSVHRESHTETVDDVLVAEHCAGPALFRLRHHSLSPDGCGHHLQARIGAHGGDRGCSGSLLCAGGLKRRCVSHQYRRPLRGGARDHYRLISLSAHPRVDTRPPGSFILP